MHCLEYVDPTDWTTYVSMHADSQEIRDQTLELMNSHRLEDHWLPKNDDGSRLSIRDHWVGAVAIAQPNPGDQFIEQDIELGEILGRGTANLVFQACQIRVRNNCFVVKTPIHCNQPQKRLTQYRIEHDIQSRAYHPNVAQIYSYGLLSKDRPFLAMELLEGKKLGQFLLQSDQSISIKLGVIIQICSTIADLHQRGISHGDLNPDNVIVVDQEETPIPKIIDFGKAKRDCTVSQLPPRESVQSFCKASGQDCTACELDTPFKTNLLRDLRSISHLLYMFLTVHHHQRLIAERYGDDIATQLIDLQQSIQWENDGSVHRECAAEIVMEIKKIAQPII